MRRILLVLALLAGCEGDHEELVKDPPKETSKPKDLPPAGAAQRPDGTVRLAWTGCDISKKAYMTEAVKAYREATGVEIVVSGGGATRGIRATAGGVADIGGTCRHCLPVQFPDKEKGAVLTHVAWDALVFFTHPDNPVNGISLAQAKGILLGDIKRWSDIEGGEDQLILCAFRRQTVQGKLSGVGYMTRLLLFNDPTKNYTKDAIFHRSSKPIEQFVEKTPYSFAVTGVSSAKKRKVKILELDRVAPTTANIGSGKYKLFRPLYLVTKGDPKGAVKDFLDWIVGADGQAVLSKAGTVNLKEGERLKALFEHWPHSADGCLIRNH